MYETEVNTPNDMIMGDHVEAKGRLDGQIYFSLIMFDAR
jgi:hypothetical protein